MAEKISKHEKSRSGISDGSLKGKKGGVTGPDGIKNQKT